MAKQNARFKAVVLAGGSGERFWPLSTPEKPKQFLNVFGGASLLRQSVWRLEAMASAEDVFVVTSGKHVALTRQELPEVPAAHIVGEPCRRDTGAAIALGTGLAGTSDADVIGFFASDHLIGDEKAFGKTVRQAIRLAEKKDAIVVIGIPPTAPSSAFGYVDPKTGRFVEKPAKAQAQGYLRKGYLWNAGLFIARAGVFRAAIRATAPVLAPLAEPLPRTDAELAKIYDPLPRISFDYAVMEKIPNVAVVRGDFGWDDVGGFQAFDKYFPHDGSGNVCEGPCRKVDAAGNICVVRGAPVALLGVSNLVVVTTPQGVLVADKGRLAEMKKLFQAPR